MTATPRRPEAWLRGPVEGVPAPLQPVAHSLIQALEDAERLAADLPLELVWKRPGGAAPIGFHLRHMATSLDRLFTYARGEALSREQLEVLAKEKEPTPDVPARALLDELAKTVERALEQLRGTPVSTLDAPRKVGRAGLESTVRGLLYHAGEHATRHAGQISTTVKVLMGSGDG